MFTYSHLRLLVALIAAATLGLAMILANGVPPDATDLVRSVGPIVVGAGLAQWLMFVLFSRRPGGAGIAVDVALWLGMVGLAGLFAGTLVMPGAGSVLGVLVTLSLPTQSAIAALVYAMGAAGGIWLMRRAKAPLRAPQAG